MLRHKRQAEVNPVVAADAAHAAVATEAAPVAAPAVTTKPRTAPPSTAPYLLHPMSSQTWMPGVRERNEYLSQQCRLDSQ